MFSKCKLLFKCNNRARSAFYEIFDFDFKIAKFALICDRIRQKSSMDDFSMLTGSSSILLDALKIGATGSICALANVFGHELVQLYDLFNSNHGMPTVNAQLIQNKLVQIDFAVK